MKKYLLAFALLIVGLGMDDSYASDIVYYEDYDLDIIFEENDKESTEDFDDDLGETDSLEEEDKNDKLNEEISNIITEEMDKVEGSYQVAVKTLEGDSDVDVDYRNTSDSLPSASTIKVFIAISAYENIERGTLKDTDSLINDIHSMLNRSDNYATNRVIDALGGFYSVNNTIEKLTGSNRTSLNRKLAKPGKENMVDVSDLIRAMEELNNPKLISKRSAEKIKDSMTNTNTKSSKLLANLPPYARGINKSGENPDRGQELDVAIIDVGSTRFSLAVAMKTDKYYDNENELRVLRNMGERITEAFYNFE
ncbi:MAG: class A beta-lactamase-related serine hydrolase [Anaerococcus sp.]|uniref:serine hydrolase n=1 Tax=Anaerococcus sp. TaxID=1872515 RepID=UPI002625B804|nr:serine hydrolase [Anaerococcus sp.]MCI5971614.1 class A beta-lactamase-related serine hydrolase [Anaerococcus sp.]MDD6918385.1 serine hydrolase [Peptoniphilaceae bacterium]MDY2927228.1 serine hydrolase [Anaerococcus sp.]